MTRFQPRSFLLPLLMTFAITGTATVPVWAEEAAQGAQTEEWPCVARKVLEISPAQIWDGPSLEGTEGWRNDDEVRRLSEFVVARRIPVEEADAAIKKFAEATPEAERDKRLTSLFAGVLSRINDERKVVMSGIERFHKRQKARAEAIEKQGITLPAQTAAPGETAVPASELDKVSEDEDKWKWEVRVFQERQQNIPIACEIPQLIEERAGEIARTIRQYMKS